MALAGRDAIGFFVYRTDFQTMPRHFGEFLQERGSSPGVFLVKQSSPVGDVIDELVLIWAASDAEEWKDRILEIPL